MSIKEIVKDDLDILIKRYLNSLKDKTDPEPILTSLEHDVKAKLVPIDPEQTTQTIHHITLLNENINALLNDYVILPVFVANEIMQFSFVSCHVGICDEN